MSAFAAQATALAGVWQLDRQPRADARGWFERLFCADELRAYGHPGVVAQANRSFTRACGAVRGLHFQHPPHGEWKVLTCLRGRVLDVIADLRQGSATFLRHVAIELDGASQRMLLVPPGCAHGFQTLTSDCEMLYFHSHPYVSAAEGGVRTDDPRLGISWPLPIAERSPRDAAHPLITADFAGIAP